MMVCCLSAIFGIVGVFLGSGKFLENAPFVTKVAVVGVSVWYLGKAVVKWSEWV